MYGRMPGFHLSERGREQVEVTARELEKEDISAIYTSPMLRARQTARILARSHPDVPVRTSSLINEVQTGWQGERWSNIPGNLNLYDKKINPGDESMRDVADRTVRFIKRVLKRHPGKTVLCVSHADTIMIMKVAAMGRELTLSNIRQPDYPDHVSITKLVYDANGLLDSVSYQSPAKGLIKPPERVRKETPSEVSEEAVSAK